MTDTGNIPIDPARWKQKAAAFVTRTHRHLWGKNNEDPLVFLFRKGLSNEFIRQMHLGWNKHGQERDLTKWGLDPDVEAFQRFFLPPGIVFPYIIEKTLVSVIILPMEGDDPPCMVPGSRTGPITLGNGKGVVYDDVFEAFRQFQDTGGPVTIRLT